MPRKDKTFTDKDVARIICDHLDNDEKDRLQTLFRQDGFDCNFKYDEEANEEEKEELRDINIEVEIDAGILSGIAGFFTGLLVATENAYEEEKLQNELENQARKDNIQRNLIFLRGLQDNIPRGRNRQSYLDALSTIDTESDILAPCVAINEVYLEVDRAGKELANEVQKIEKKIKSLTERVKNWFD